MITQINGCKVCLPTYSAVQQTFASRRTEATRFASLLAPPLKLSKTASPLKQ